MANETRPDDLSKEEAEQFFADFYFGKHHFPSEIKQFGGGWSMAHYGDLSTYDFNHLTRLVVMGHDRAIRVGVMQGGPRGVKITLHKRDRDSKVMQLRHPTLEDAVTHIRKPK